MSNNDDDRDGLVLVGKIPIDVHGVGRTLTAGARPRTNQGDRLQ